MKYVLRRFETNWRQISLFNASLSLFAADKSLLMTLGALICGWHCMKVFKLKSQTRGRWFLSCIIWNALTFGTKSSKSLRF